MKKAVSMMVMMLLLLNVSFGYTLTITYNGNETTREVAGGESVIVGLVSRESANYTVDTENTVLKIYGNRRQFVMPEENVGITIYAVEESGTVFAEIAQVGDYVTYYPTQTACDLTALTGIEQESLNPSKTIQWRVLSNDGTNVELVSADSVGELALGASFMNQAGTAIAYGISSNVEISKTHYANAIKILNNISETYVNTTFAEEGRGLGWNGTSAETFDTSTYPITLAATGENENFTNGEPYSDAEYLSATAIEDVTTLINNDMLHSSGDIWLASRNLMPDSSMTAFAVVTVDTSGNLRNSSFYVETPEPRLATSYYSHGIRPVVKLKSRLNVTGSGTAEETYVLTEEEKIVVTFENNGGNEIYLKSVTTGSIYGTLPEVTKENYALEGWYLDEGLTQKVTSETTVTATGNHTLYAKWREPNLADKAKVGDYVTYTPTATICDLTTITGVTQDSLTPSSTTAWRVLNVDKENGIVEIVSVDSVGTLTLGGSYSYMNADGTFSSGNAENIALSKDNYLRSIKILNDISETYVDEEVATGGRGLGWNGNSMEEMDINIYPLTYEGSYSEDTGIGEPYNDSKLTFDIVNSTVAIKDLEVLIDNNMLHSDGNVWLASRGARVNVDNNVCFYISCMDSSGSLNSDSWYNAYTGGNADAFAGSHGVRPVVSLKSGISATGAGTEGSPWVIN